MCCTQYIANFMLFLAMKLKKIRFNKVRAKKTEILTSFGPLFDPGYTYTITTRSKESYTAQLNLKYTRNG